MRHIRFLLARVVLSLLVVLLIYLVFNWRGFFQFLYPVHYGEVITKYSAQYEVDPFLVASIILVESNFQEKAESSKGAAGLMQLMPDTAGWVLEQLGESVTEPDVFAPEVNIRMGTWYLSSLYRQFGDWVIALAAYNGGRGNVQKWLDEAKWSGEHETISDIPFGETRFYVSRVMRAHQWYKRAYRNDWDYALVAGSTKSKKYLKSLEGLVYWVKRFVFSVMRPN